MKNEIIDSLIKKKQEEKHDELVRSQTKSPIIFATSLPILFGLLFGLRLDEPSKLFSSSFLEIITLIFKCQAAFALIACYGITLNWLIHWLIERKRKSVLSGDVWYLCVIASKFVDKNVNESNSFLVLRNGKTAEDVEDEFLALLLLIWARKLHKESSTYKSAFETTCFECCPDAYAIFLGLKQAVTFMLYSDDFIDIMRLQSKTSSYMKLSYAIELCARNLVTSEENAQWLMRCFCKGLSDFITISKIV